MDAGTGGGRKEGGEEDDHRKGVKGLREERGKDGGRRGWQSVSRDAKDNRMLRKPSFVRTRIGKHLRAGDSAGGKGTGTGGEDLPALVAAHHSPQRGQFGGKVSMVVEGCSRRHAHPDDDDDDVDDADDDTFCMVVFAS